MTTKTRAMLMHPDFSISSSFGVVEGLYYKQWGFWRRFKRFDLPTIPEEMVVSSYDFNYMNQSRKITQIDSVFFSSNAGKHYFAQYCEQLKDTVRAYQLEIDRVMLSDLTRWSFTIEIKDASASGGVRNIEGFTELGYDDLEKTALQLKQVSTQSLVFNNDEDDETNSAIYEQYLTLCDYAAIDGENVVLHYYDYDDESSDDAYEILHQATLARRPFADASFDVYQFVKKHVDGVCKALEIHLKTMKKS